MTNTCRSCTAPAELNLCNRCLGDLRDLLRKLPAWLKELEREAIGDVRKSDGGKGGTRREPFKGDDLALTRCVCSVPGSVHPEHFGFVCGATIDDKETA